MHKLSRYVFETVDEAGTPVLYNTVTNVALPVTADQETLQANHFLDGAEKAAIFQKLFAKTDRCSFTIVPTWECNLRCSHCTVLKKLVRKDTVSVDADKTVDFIKRFAEYYKIPKLSITFVGGEPLLKTQLLLDIINKTQHFAQSRYFVTTNLATDLNNEVISCLRHMNGITVSLDGMHDEHNSQRNPFENNFDAFDRTFENIKNLIKIGLRKKLMIQAALKDKFINNDHKIRFYTALLKIGISEKQIKFGCIHPTEYAIAPTTSFINYLRRPIIVDSICCKYRYYQYVINKNEVYSDFYAWKKIGTLDDAIDLIEKTHKTEIVANMPALKDGKCMSCPVLGACWGRCSNGDMDQKNKPSDYCDQDGLISLVKDKAKSGQLISSFRK